LVASSGETAGISEINLSNKKAESCLYSELLSIFSMEQHGIYCAVRALCKITNYGYSLGFIPFYCPKGTTTWVVSPTRRCIIAMKFLILYSQICLICYNTYKLWITEGAPLARRIHILYTSAAFIVLTFNMNVVHQDPTIVPTLMNSLLRSIHKHYKNGM